MVKNYPKRDFGGIRQESRHFTGRIVYTSHMAANSASAFPPMRDHATTEEMLRPSGLPWTALRNGFYAASGIAMMGDALKTGRLEAPADGNVAWTAHADLADAAAMIQANEGHRDESYDGPTPPLTGSQLLDFEDLAAMASELLGKPFHRTMFDDEELRARMTARGAPASAIGTVLGFFIASRNGEFATVDPTLAQLLGRGPTTLRDVMAQAAGRTDY